MGMVMATQPGHNSIYAFRGYEALMLGRIPDIL